MVERNIILFQYGEMRMKNHSPQELKPEPIAKGASNAMDAKERAFIRDKPADIIKDKRAVNGN